MKIDSDTIIESIENIVNSEVGSINIFWGLLSLFSSAKTGGLTIQAQKTYCIDQNCIGRFLTDWFSYSETEKQDAGSVKTLYFMLASDWSSKLAEFMKIPSEEGRKPSVIDYAIFFSKNIEFDAETISIKQIVNNFIETIGLKLEDLNNIFNMNYEDNELVLIESYKKSYFFEKFKEAFSIDSGNTTLSFDKGGTTIASHPKELSRAPFIQTLYSGMSIQNIILVSNESLEKSYRFGTHNVEVSKNESVANTIYYGAPGTGKSHRIDNILDEVPKENKERVTFHPEYDYTSFVGGYRPVSEEDDNGNEDIKYKFVPQVFTNLYVKAWLNPDKQFYLVIEEINRGNCAEIFGDIFQLLEQGKSYEITPSNELKEYLDNKLGKHHDGIINGLKMPPNLSILATMNTSDQSLFPMDSAFKRRWDWEYIPINYDRDDGNLSSKFKVYISDSQYFCWLDFIEKVNKKIKDNPNLGMDKCIGNYFIKPESESISLKTFVNKAIFYLWNDVFKDEFGDESIFNVNISYEDFFPIETKGKEQVIAILDSLEVKYHLKTVTEVAANEDTD